RRRRRPGSRSPPRLLHSAATWLRLLLVGVGDSGPRAARPAQSQQAGISVAPARRYRGAVTTARERGRCRERLQRLSGSTLDGASLRRAAIADLQHTIGFDRWCWPLADPISLLPASGLAEHDYVLGVPRALELEYSADDVAAKHVLARRRNAATSMSAETG